MNYKNIILGFVAGASIGAVVAILMSPDKGSDTRQKIADKTSDLGNSIKDYVVSLFKKEKNATNGAIRSMEAPMG